MTDSLASVTAGQWLLAVLPIALLVALVLRDRLPTAITAAVTTVTAIVVAALTFGSGPQVLAVAVGKGLWTGLWILYVIWPALLLYHVARRVGFDRMGHVLSSILPRRVETVLLVAWVFPSFVQGVAGFGTPIAIAAPLLLSLGVGKVRSVALPLIGYQWSVTFGSMGSSFYMGALTAGLTGSEFFFYARDAALILGVNLIVTGALVCLVYGGAQALREGARMLAVCGVLMAVALNVAVRVEPAIGSLAAGAAGFLGVVALRALSRVVPVRPDATASDPLRAVAGGDGPVAGDNPRGWRRRLPGDLAGARSATTAAPAATLVAGAPAWDIVAPDTPTVGDGNGSSPPRRPLLVTLPYGYLLVLVLAVFLPPASRAFVKTNWLVGPSFPGTTTALGFDTAAVSPFTPIALLGHPGTYILAAAALGLLTYRLAGIWPAGALPGTLRTWLGQVRKASPSVVALTTLATVLVDAGMVRTIAVGAAEVTGALFPAVSPMIGALGSFTTGSTTTSNALFSALQRDVALLIGLHPSELLAAQTAGGNIGNAFAPVVILIGATAVGARERVSEIFRLVLPPVAVLLAVVVVLTFLLIAAR